MGGLVVLAIFAILYFFLIKPELERPSGSRPPAKKDEPPAKNPQSAKRKS